MLCFQRNWFRADFTIKVFYWGWLRVSFARVLTAARKLSILRKMCKKVGGILSGVL